VCRCVVIMAVGLGSLMAAFLIGHWSCLLVLGGSSYWCRPIVELELELDRLRVDRVLSARNNGRNSRSSAGEMCIVGMEDMEGLGLDSVVEGVVLVDVVEERRDGNKACIIWRVRTADILAGWVVCLGGRK